MGKKAVALLLIALFTFGGCYTLNHTVGDGAKGSTVQSERQWYILFGLIPLNTVDSKAMAKGAKDYTITSQMTFVDFIIGIFTSIVTVQPHTVQVKY